jgi:hypothetical protein
MLTITGEDNPFLCDCSTESLETIDFIQNAWKYNIKFVGNLLCHNGNVLHEVDLWKTQAECSNTHTILGITLTYSLVVALCISCFIIYKYRYRIYTALLRYRYRHNIRYNGTFTYDAYLLFDDEDRFWVNDILMNILEGSYGFKLCNPLRDFLVGVVKYNQVIDMYNECRTAIIVISNNTLNSQDCDFQFDHIYGEYIKSNGTKKYIIVKLGNLNRHPQSHFLKRLLRTNDYLELEWPDKYTRSGLRGKTLHEINNEKISLFWTKQVNKIYQVLSTRIPKKEVVDQMTSHVGLEEYHQNEINPLMDNCG